MKTQLLEAPYTEVLSCIEKFGPKKEDYPKLNSFITTVAQPGSNKDLLELLQPVLNTTETLYGHTLLKPYGYAGDFMLIEKMYQYYVSPKPQFKNWDIYYHSHKATDAVRNRKKYFIKLMNDKIKDRNAEFKVLILGSGPATDVNEFLNENPGCQVHFDLLDIDARAIEYATNKNKKHIEKLTFIKKNVLRFKPENTYNLIWSAGLFDYLNDKYFVSLLSRFSNFLKENGEMVIGNFSDNNPTKKVMEVLGEWYLLHRNDKYLTQLALNAGFKKEKISVEAEPLGINLFLRLSDG